jgi:N utilization substance protein A
MEKISAEQLETLRKLIEEYVEIVEEELDEREYPEPEVSGEAEPEADTAEETESPEEYECPECGAKITVDMTSCPNCGIGLSFEYEDE